MLDADAGSSVPKFVGIVAGGDVGVDAGYSVKVSSVSAFSAGSVDPEKSLLAPAMPSR